MRSLIAILLLSVLGADAFTFTCNQVKKLIRDKTSFNTANACVALDEFIPRASGSASDPVPWTTQVYFQDSSPRGEKWSFAETAVIGCVSGFDSMSQWRIVTDREDQGEGIDCTYEFTVFFSSIESILVTAGNEAKHHRSYQAYNFTVVAPRGGIMIDFSCNNTQEPLNFYTGLGNGAGEDMFYYGSSKCDDRLSLLAWDTAITINVPNDGYIMITYWGTGGYVSLGSVSYDVLLLGSGKSNAIVQHGDEDKFIWLSPTISDDLKFHIDGIAQFDPLNGNSLVFSADCKQNNCTGTIVPVIPGDVHLLLEADFLAINYFTHVPDDQWKNDDLFFFRIATTPLNSTDPPPTMPPPKPSTSYSCGCDLTEGKAMYASSLWVDVVFIVDVSKAMGTDGINKASAMIDSIVSSLNIGNVGPRPSQKYSRVGIVAASDTDEVINDLVSPVPSPLKLTPASSDEADIGKAFESARYLLTRNSRPSTRQIIYIIAASDSSNTDHGQPRISKTFDATFDAELFKMSGGLIAITETDAAFEHIFPFSNLASPGYYNTGFNDNVNVDLKLLCDANCFCPGPMTAFIPDDLDRITAVGGCFHTQSSTDPYALAKEACQSQGALLTSIHDADKQLFLMQMISEFGTKKPFWIGAEYNGVEWEWIDDNNSTYANWGTGQPDLSNGRCAYAQQTTGFNSGWFSGECSDDHYYICEKPPCTVDNYCT